MIPANIDAACILKDLKEWGWRDWKIERACGFCQGYIAQVRLGLNGEKGIREMAYGKAARLYNFWESERELQPEST